MGVSGNSPRSGTFRSCNRVIGDSGRGSDVLIGPRPLSGEAGHRREPGLVEDLDLSVTQPEQLLGLETLQDPVDAGASTTDEVGEDTLAEVDDAMLGLADKDEGGLGFEPAGEELDQSGLGARQAGRDQDSTAGAQDANGRTALAPR